MAQKRPNPTSLLEGQPAVNTNSSEPGLFFKASDGSLFKVGPVAVTTGANAPNSAAVGQSGNLIGETWLDGRSPLNSPVLKVYNGSQWVTASGFTVNNSNGNFSLSRRLTVSTLVANGTGANAYIRVPTGPSTDENQIVPAAGMVRFDETLGGFRGYDGTKWSDLSSGNLTSLTVDGDVQINGGLSVDGDITLGNDNTIDTLQVNASTTLSGDTTIGTNYGNSLTVEASTIFAASTGHINRQPIRLYTGLAEGSNFVGFKAPASVSSSVTWTLPSGDGTAGYVLTTDGAGNLSWDLGVGAAAGLNGQVQFNSSGQLAASGLLTINPTGTKVNIACDLLPDEDNLRNIGSSDLRFANIYTGDLHLANERGDWTMIEEAEYLSLRNNKTGKLFRLLMEEV